MTYGATVREVGGDASATRQFSLAEFEPQKQNRQRLAGAAGALGRAAFRAPQQLYELVRTFWPIPKTREWAYVSRFDDVQEVLRRDDVFEVPWGDKVTLLNGADIKQNFILGMPRGRDYYELHREVVRAFPRDEAIREVPPIAARHAEDLIGEAMVSDGRARLDAVEGLITRVATRVCRDYYGVSIPEEHEVAFGHWSMAMSAYMFGDPDDQTLVSVAEAGAELVRALVDSSVAAGGAKGTVLARLQSGGKMTPGRQRVHLVGMITGFVPTNTMAGGHILEMLLSHPRMFAAAAAAAKSGDDELLRRCLFEAMRFMPLNPGPFRRCVQDCTIAEGTRRATKIRKGMRILVGTHSAMFDRRRVERPFRYDPEREPGIYMLFGHGLHWCTGAFIAEAHIVQTFKALLRQDGLVRTRGPKGRMERLGPFPRHLFVDFRT